jgi:hypothetical protein
MKYKRVPNLIIPGAAKSGTSSLHEYLNMHKDIYMSSDKEPHYFSNDIKYMNNKEEYYNLFQVDQDYLYYGESSTGYMVFPNVISRIKNELEKPKFIFILRNPIDRLYSHYWWLKGVGHETLSFEKAIKKDMHIEPISGNKKGIMGYKNYYQWGLYGKWISNYYDEFSRKDIHVITFENLKNNPLETVNSCFDFLEVSRIDNIKSLQSNKTVILKNAQFFGKFDRLTRKDNYFINFLRNNDITKRLGKEVIRRVNSIKNQSVTNKKYPELDHYGRKWIKDLYYNDYLTLKKVTGLDFWKDFQK